MRRPAGMGDSGCACQRCLTQRLFQLSDFADGSRWLKVDVSIECGSGHYTDKVVPLAWAAVVIYPVGLIVLNASLLFCARKAIQKNEVTELSTAIRFLHKEYEQHVFWWELVEMARRFLLVGLYVIWPFAQGTIMQVAMASLTAVIFLAVQLQAAPFVQQLDDYLALCCSLSLTVCAKCEAKRGQQLVLSTHEFLCACHGVARWWPGDVPVHHLLQVREPGSAA